MYEEEKDRELGSEGGFVRREIPVHARVLYAMITG